MLAGLNLDGGEPSGTYCNDCRSWLLAVVPRWLVGSTSSTKEGARLEVVRNAALFPLIVLAPSSRWQGHSGDGSLRAALTDRFAAELRYGLEYTRAATTVAVGDGSGSTSIGQGSIALDAPIKVKVTYLFHCAVPIVRTLICGSLDTAHEQLQDQSVGGLVRAFFFGTRPSPSNELARLTSSGSRFAVLRGEATLPNQGAAYAHETDS
jgi:hypothetical protein